MPTIKKWSTGQLGNVYPDHSERNNPNTRGLSIDGVPGVEGYIEEDRVVADQDNRPLSNLAQNDQILENNLSSVASEVDYGVLRGKDNELRIEILQKGTYKNPEEDGYIEITPIRVNSGQAIVDGQVVSIGNQKIIYFLKDDGSYIFPDYNEHEGKIVIPVSDDLYTGEYRPVYDTVSTGLPENFTNYEIKIINKYDNAPDRVTYFKVYRDWEDIIPYAPHTEEDETELNFIYDENYGRESEGIWLNGNGVDNIKISDVTVKKNITVKDKLLPNNKFIQNGNTYEQYIVTDGIFFDNIPFKTDIQDKQNIQDIYVTNDGSIYFVYKHKTANESLYYLPSGSTQATNVALLNFANQAINKLVEINDVLYILGTNGYTATYDLVAKTGSVVKITIGTTDDFKDAIFFQNKIWIASNKKIYVDGNEINFASEIDTISGGTDVVDEINTLSIISGNFFVDSSLKTNIKNYLKIPSFEAGGIGSLPAHWEGQGAINPSGKYGNYKVVLQAGEEIKQTVYSDFKIGDVVTLSAYAKSLVSGDVELIIDDGTIASTTITTSQDWERFSLSHTLLDDGDIVVKIKNISSQPIQIDAVQLEIGNLNQFVEGFEYLFIGFKKNSADVHNPPFAFIDSKRLSQINYPIGIYGDIKTVNAVAEKQSNNVVFIDDINIYSLTILNDEDEYDRVSITNLTENNPELKLNGKIEQLKTVDIFENRVFFGGSILNKAISFNIIDKEEHIIDFIQPNDISIRDHLDPNVSLYYDVLDLLGNRKVINAHDNIGMSVEFSRVDDIYETRSLVGEAGTYLPGRYYLFAIKIDGGEPIVLDIQMPALYNGPISVEDVYNLLVQRYNEKYTTQTIKFNIAYSKARVDGLYSIGKDRITRHVRGNIGKIFKQENVDKQNHYDKGVYIILDSAILRSKYDTNIKKTNGVYINKPDVVAEVENITQLPQSANFDDVYHVKDFGYYRWNGTTWIDTGYIYKWNLSATDHSAREFKNRYNKPVTFHDESVNKNWINLPITPGYKLLPGSLRVKTNVNTEIGFSENKDYFVDYDTARIIRSSLTNLIKDSNFEFVETPSSEWSKYLSTTIGSTLHLNKKIESYLTFDGEEKITGSCASAYIESPGSNFGSIYQYVTPKSLNVGDTYTFSVKLKTNKFKTGFIKIVERTNKTAAFDTHNGVSETQYIIGDDNDTFNEWHTYTVSHTITSSSSKHLRVEINLQVENIYEQLFIKEAQLERNQIRTPYVKEINNSRIDAGLTVYVDFTESRELVNGVDYIFDTQNRKVVYHGNLDDDTQIYFDYKYEKIFNPYLFETSIPRFDVGYDARDDYFLYLYAGRIWAINFVLSLLSQDEENPLIVSYKYHNPRIDKIKIRNKVDQYGNYAYIVKGTPDEVNPYAPYDSGTDRSVYTIEVARDKIEDVESNDVIYAINVFDYDFNNNDIYDRRVYVDSRDNKFYNISLYDQTVGYFPYTKDFMSTSGMSPINRLYASKIVDIIKNFEIKQLEEIGAWGPNYQLALRNLHAYPATSVTTFVDVDSGNDANSGELFLPLKTIKEAIKRIKNGASPYIVVKSQSLITEDVEIDLPVSQVKIFAQSYARWSGNIQNKTPVMLQGFQFENHNNYIIEDIEYCYCTFINSTVNNYIPVNITFNKCKVEDGKNTFLYVKNTLFPSPFIHPYMRNVSADDTIPGNPESVATSDTESIHPGVGSYNKRLTSNPEVTYKFFRCLIANMDDDIVRYDLQDNENWVSKFVFNRSTIVNNNNLFYTNKSSQDILYNECIIWNNGETRLTEKKYFDSQSNITFQNCYTDTGLTDESFKLNFNPNGFIFGRETCINGKDFEPGFISAQEGFENYRLRSEAMGFLVNSVCIGRAADGRDLGCYDELRERLDVEVPKKLKSYFAFLGEGIHYPIVLNSEKITFTLEFKPSNSFSSPAVLFDTRSSASDKDYIMVCYNNNKGNKIVDIEPDEDALITDPYTFKIIVSNEKIRYAVVSPIEIYSDSDYQVWHKLSFTVNYEKTFNEKAAFDEKDKYQNIITLYHNEELAVESFLKNDLSYDEHNTLLDGNNSDSTNDWNYNNISRFVTIGSTYNQRFILNGYYSELRIDNKFINRKELEAWNKKVVPFNDPIRYVDQNNLARTFDSSIINEMWTLKTKFDVGAKGKRFNEYTHKRFTYDDGELTWALTNPTTNFINNSDLSKPIFASITTDVPPNNDTENLFPVVFNGLMTIKTIGGNSFDSVGVTIYFGAGKQFYSHDEILAFISGELAKPANAPTKINILKLKDNRFRILTKDYLASQIEVNFENGGDGDDFGFETESGQGNGYYVVANPDGSKTISGARDSSSIVIVSGISLDMQAEHNAWLEFDNEYTKFSPTSLGISRIITNNNKDDVANDDKEHKYIRFITNRKLLGSNLGIYNENDATPKEYTYSTYIYRRSNTFAKSDVKVIVRENDIEKEYEFDTIDNIYGYWWLASKTIRVESDPQADIGIIIKGEVECYFNVFQLEEGTFASPYVINSDAESGIIEVDKSILSEDRGAIFFRFKPLFRYNTTSKKVLFEVLTEKTNEDTGVKEADILKGFKVWYEYDDEKEVGYIQFRTSAIEAEGVRPDESAWEIAVLEQFWNTWHTIVLSYDFDTKRFIYFFDYFKNSVDASISKHKFFTNLSIGKNAILKVENGEPVFTFGAESADILVKDLLITNYITSDNELKNWINAHEFYKETLFNNLLESYQTEMYDTIAKIEGLTHDSYNIESNINILNGRVSVLEGLVDSDIDLTLIKVRQDELRNEVYHNTNGILAKINILDNQRALHDTRITENRNNIVIHEGLIQENTNNIALEISNRINAIDSLIARLSSHVLGDGASMIGVHDPSNKFAATDVESVLLELEGRVAAAENSITTINTTINGIQQTAILMQQGDGSDGLWSETNAIDNGWNIASLRKDADSMALSISAIETNLSQEVQNRIDGDLAVSQSMTTLINTSISDLAGIGRMGETVKGNADAIAINTAAITALQSSSSSTDAELNKVKDGLDGTTWDATMNVKAHEDRLNAVDTLITSHTATLAEHTTTIDGLEDGLSDANTAISQETVARIAGDVLITTNLSSTSPGQGASLISISDAAGSFTATTVEGALQEIDGKLQALAGSINWQSSVATFADLPLIGNNLNDSRIVQNDGDGRRAQYVWNGTTWAKISDVDWGDATAITYDNSSSGLLSTDVKAAIDELYNRSVAPNNIEVNVTTPNWVAIPGSYYYDIVHGLETTNIAVRAVNEFGQEFGVEEIERLDANTVRVSVSNPINSTFTIFGAHNSYSKVVGSWTLVGGMYLKDIIHGFNTKNIMVSVFNIITGERIGVESIDFIDDNAIRVVTDNNINVVNVFVLKQTSNATTKDIEYWVPSNGMYESILPLALDYDAVYSFYDPITSKTVEVDSVKFEGGMMKIRRTQNTPLRMVILK